MDKEDRKVIVRVPSEAAMDEFELGQEVTITIKGKVSGGRFSLEVEDWDDARGNLEIEVETIEAEGKNIFDSLAD
jgi:NAD(P)H-flavin reductase